MPRPIVQLFALLLVSCVVFMVCVAYLGVFGNDVSGRHGSAAALPAALGASADSDNNSIIINNNNNGNNLRNLRSSDEPVPSGVTVSDKGRNITVKASSINNNVIRKLSPAKPGVGSEAGAIDVAMILCNVDEKPSLKFNFRRMVRSLLGHCAADVDVRLHLVTDAVSLRFARSVVDEQSALRPRPVHVAAYQVADFVARYGTDVETLSTYFTNKRGAYYSQALFFVTLYLPDLLPADVDGLVFLDADVEFRASVARLAQHLDAFDERQLLALAPELSPVYRHVLYEYRKRHNATLLGEAQGRGFPGYNSGVVLMKLQRLRRSKLYRSLRAEPALARLAAKYSFKGHLGDQDFYTLLALEHPHLFYTLPCNWNRQLCQWWRSKGYDDQFDDFYRCRGFIYVYHGNCNSQIPSET